MMKIKSNKNRKIGRFSIGSFFSKSVQNQILFPFLILIVLTGGIVAFVSYNYSVKNTTDELSKSVESQMKSMDTTFEMFFENIANTLERFTSKEDIVNYSTEDRNNVLQYFKETQETTPSIGSIYAAIDKSGEVIIYPEADLGANFTVKDRSWYQEAIQADGEVIWTEPYVDASTGNTVVTAAKAYYNNGNLEGVIASDVFVDTLISMINEIKIGETGYAVIFDKSGKLLAHPDKDYVGKDESGEDYYKKIISAGERGIIEYQFNGEDKIIGFNKNATTHWIIGGTVYTDDFKEKAQSIITPILITLSIVITLSIFVSIIVTRRITKPIKKVMERMTSIAQGDLSQEPLSAKSEDEIGQLVRATNEMNHQMKGLLNQIHEVSETVSAQSEELTQSAMEVKTGSEQVASTMQELASGSETQADSASDLASGMNTFAEKVQEANENGYRIEENSKIVLNMTKDGSELMKMSIHQMDKIDTIVLDSVKKVQGLDKQSQEISNLVTVIKDVADQTNLLALNAAIEAARAGEHGKGFAVVADEVRKLAEQVSDSVTDITDIVSTIQKESDLVSESLQVGYKEVEQGKAQIESTGQTFEGINEAVSEMVNSITTIALNLAEIAANSQEMNGSVEEIASVSEESAAGIEQTAASVQQTSSIMEEVAASSEHLAKLAEQLNELVRQFKL